LQNNKNKTKHCRNIVQKGDLHELCPQSHGADLMFMETKSPILRYNPCSCLDRLGEARCHSQGK